MDGPGADRRRTGAERQPGRRARGPRRPRHRPAALILLLLALAVPIVITAASASGEGALVRIGAAPRLPRGSVDLGAAPASAAISGAVVLRPRDQQALEQFIAAVTTKGSPQFGRYLSKGRFAADFGPSATTVAAVRSELAGDGLRVGTTSSDGLLVHFSGSAAHVAGAFATGLHRYRLADGRIARAATSAPALPSSLAGSVATVLGLDELKRAQPSRIHRNASLAGRFAAAKAPSFPHPPGSPDACANAKLGASEYGGLTDDEIGYAYGAFGLYGEGDTGSGVHIGVFEQEPFAPSDIQHFDACYFGAKGAAAMLSRLDIVALEGGIPQGPGSDGEALLDVEDVSAMAPGANIDVYENPETAGGEVAEIAAMVNEDRDQIITSSYGQACEQEEEAGQPGTQQTLNYLFEQGAAQGQTFLGAAGDNGSDSCEEDHREATPQPGQNPVSAGEIASQPYVLGVGGTTITDATQPVHEHVWNDGGEGGAGGGGISQSFAMPSWQREATLPGIALPGGPDYTNAANVEQRFGYPTGFCEDTLPGAEATTPCRLEPDVSAQADEFTGAVTVYSEEYRGEHGLESAPDGWITSGGTSSATPIWAGMLALADASPTCRENPATASGVGFVSPLLYAIASNPTAYAASFNDITKGNIDQYDLDEGKVFPARHGYDLASGLGSPRMSGPGNTAGLAYYLCSYAASALAPTVSGLSPSSGSTAGGENVKVTGSGFESAGAADVAAVQVGVWRVPASAIDVHSATSLTVTLPPALDTLSAGAPPSEDGAGAADVIVTLSDDRSSAPGPDARFEYVDTAKKTAIPSVTGVTPYGGSEVAPAQVMILGSGFTDASEVSFGGVKAASFKVIDDSRIEVAPPPYAAGHSACSPLPAGGVYAGENAANDICQVQVVVRDSAGASSTAPILPPFEGAPSFEQDGALEAPLGCGCEVYPAPSEFDYAPAPSIASVSTSAGANSLASETGETLITIHGSGLNRATLDYTDFEVPGRGAATEQEISFVSGNEIQVAAPALAESAQTASVDGLSIPLSIRTLAGETAQSAVQYAGVPRVAAVANTTSKVTLKGIGGAPDGGGTPIRLTGKGLLGQVTLVRFTDSESPSSEGSSFTLAASTDTHLETQTVAQSPALANVQACTVSGCSTASKVARLFLYPPGQPAVESLTPPSGSAAGGTAVTVHGKNLGCPLSVAFGGAKGASFSIAESILACASTGTVGAVSPPEKSAVKVPVTVTTLASYFSGSGDVPGEAQFTYTSP